MSHLRTGETLEVNLSRDMQNIQWFVKRSMVLSSATNAKSFKKLLEASKNMSAVMVYSGGKPLDVSMTIIFGSLRMSPFFNLMQEGSSCILHKAAFVSSVRGI